MVRLPAGAAPVAAAFKANVVGERRAAIAGVDVRYQLARRDPARPWSSAGYDEDGAIYVDEALLALDGRYADLLALHEQAELRRKAAGRSHAEAHRRAWVEEALAARRALAPADLGRYLRWRVGQYPATKVPEPEAVAAELAGILAAERPRRGELLRAITAHRL